MYQITQVLLLNSWILQSTIKAHASIGPNFESLPVRALSHCFFLYAGSAITKAKMHLHGFVNIFDIFSEQKKRITTKIINFMAVSNFYKLRQWCTTGSRKMASVLQDDKRANIVKLTITRSFRNQIRSGLLYLNAK